MFDADLHGSKTVLACTVVVTCLLATIAVADEIPRDPEPRWWKGNLHTHSLWSDGNDFPEMIAEWYRTHGYNFLALSDHNVLSEGQRWMRHSVIVKRGGRNVINKYVNRFGMDWVETRDLPDSDTDYEVRLKPFSEYRSIAEQRGKFLMVPSEEISDSVDGLPIHLNAANLQRLIDPLGGDTVSAAIEANLRAANDQATRLGREILVHLNHPNFGYGVSATDLAHAVSEKFFEVYNGHTGVNQLGDKDHPSIEHLWDLANTIRLGQLNAPPLFGVATDDSHHYHGGSNSPGRGWVMVRATHLTPESLIRAMKRGDFYASTGVKLKSVAYDATIKTLRLVVDADDDDDGVQYTTQFIGTPRHAIVERSGAASADESATKTSSPTDADANKTAPSNQETVESGTAPKPGEERPKPAGNVSSIYAKPPPGIDTRNVGTVLLTVTGTEAAYQLTGDELYVRAIVTSSRQHTNPSLDGQHQAAWTQPFGW